jgi:hypothetical protein
MQRNLVMLAAAVVLAGTGLHADDGNDKEDANEGGSPVAEIRVPEDELRVRFPAFAMTSAELRLVATVERDADNRRLRVVIDSGSFYRSSELQLDGLEAPRLHDLRWQPFPVGSYCVVTTLFKATGQSVSSRRRYRVVGPDTITEPAIFSSLGLDGGSPQAATYAGMDADPPPGCPGE